MRLSLLLKLQLLYAAMGASFNLASLLAGVLGSGPLASTNPYLGLAVMLAYCSFLLAALKKHFPLYRLLMVCSLLVFGHSGIYVHLVQVQHQPELYYSAIVAIVRLLLMHLALG